MSGAKDIIALAVEKLIDAEEATDNQARECIKIRRALDAANERADRLERSLQESHAQQAQLAKKLQALTVPVRGAIGGAE